MTALLWLALTANTADAYRFLGSIPSWFGGNCSGPLTLPGDGATSSFIDNTIRSDQTWSITCP